MLDTRTELSDLKGPLYEWRCGSFHCAVYGLGPSVCLIVTVGDAQVLLRAVPDPREEPRTVHHIDVNGGEIVIDCASNLAAHRIKMSSLVRGELVTIRCTSSILPVNDLVLTNRERDLLLMRANGDRAAPAPRIFASQRGMQTGSLFAAEDSSADFSFFYLQNFSSLAAYFEQTHTTPADSVCGTWPELGFQLPIDPTGKLLASNEYVISDALLTLRRGAPHDDGEASEQYLDALASTLRLIQPTQTEFHHWPAKATNTVFDLSLSPLCRRDIAGHRYLTPYVDDKVKPPESMVQLSVLVALKEYEAWSGERLTLARELIESLPTFFDDDVGSIVRWLPGVRFSEREDEHQTHDAMDSWYLYHILFNLARLARAGVRVARTLLKKSLPFAMRVARRFGYRWPIFYSLRTLDVVQAEASKGSGGENDVTGLYALVMLHAHELFKDQEYLQEAMRAATALEGLGFRVTYQTNTTGFAAEAMLRLALLTGDERYRKLSHICLANIFNTMAIWERSYGHARCYSTFFSLYPLRDAPYVAAYEELEALAKFYEYLRLGAETVPPSVKLLMCEYARHLLSRGWAYFPAELPADVIAPKPRNGRVVRELAVPLEDLQDGLQQSGQVGQEVYGAGLALVCTTRHFHRIVGAPLLLFCEFPLFPRPNGRFEVAGDPDSTCTLRLISTDPNVAPDPKTIAVSNGDAEIRRSAEGHVLVDVRGGALIRVRNSKPRRRVR